MRSILSEEELRDALLFGVAAIVVLPLLPNRPRSFSLRVIGGLGLVLAHQPMGFG